MLRLSVTLLIVSAILVSVLSDEICENQTKMFDWKPDPDDCSAFYLCFNGSPMRYKCPPNSVAEASSKSCVTRGSELDTCSAKQAEQNLQQLKTPKCKLNKVEYSAYPQNCAGYYECGTDNANPFSPVLKECPYPLLFNDELSRCEYYITVKCGQRQEPKNPCEYTANQCTRSSHCVPCNVRFPSCAARADGLNPWIGREWSPYYVVCKDERVVYQDMCKQDGATILFHPEKRLCYDPSLMDNNST